MRAGRLRHRLVLQSKTETRDSYGSALINWTTETTVWGSIEPLSARELFAQGQLQDEARVRIVMRYVSGLDHTWRVQHTDYADSPATVRYYDIVEVIKDSHSKMLTLLTRQGVSEDTGSAEDTTYYVVNNGVNVVNSGIQVIHTP